VVDGTGIGKGGGIDNVEGGVVEVHGGVLAFGRDGGGGCGGGGYLDLHGGGGVWGERRDWHSAEGRGGC